MAQAAVGIDPAGIAAAVAGMAVPWAGNPGISVTQQIGMVKNLGSAKNFAAAGIAVEESSGTGAGEECPGLAVEVCLQSAGLVAHQQTQRLAAVAAAGQK